MRKGRIVKALSGFYYVRPEEAPWSLLTCRARGKFRKDGVTPLVGDWAMVRELEDGEGYLEELLPRKNMFTRPAVANIDQLVIVASAAVPRTDPYLIDRMLSIAALKGCKALLVLNKSDLDGAAELYRIYRAAGIRTLRVSAKSGAGIPDLRFRLTGKLSCFTGNSGVGKSSLLNALDASFSIRTGEISTALGRGRHTTRHVELYTMDFGAEVVDTPGFSSFNTEELNLELKEHLPETFPEFAPYVDQCRFTGCSHTKEAGCAVLEALERGEIQKSRHESYCRLYEELKPLREWQVKKENGT